MNGSLKMIHPSPESSHKEIKTTCGSVHLSPIPLSSLVLQALRAIQEAKEPITYNVNIIQSAIPQGQGKSREPSFSKEKSGSGSRSGLLSAML